jgi:hypothetical protein
MERGRGGRIADLVVNGCGLELEDGFVCELACHLKFEIVHVCYPGNPLWLFCQIRVLLNDGC